MTNPILSTDSYKVSHFMQYPAGTKGVFSYIEARNSATFGCHEVVSFGYQAYIDDRLSKPITMSMVDEAKALFEMHGEPFNYEGWKYIVDFHGGFLPVRIKTVAEGTVVPVGNAMLTIENTDEEHCAWLTSYVETDLLRYGWYGSTVASLSRHCKKVINRYLGLTAESPSDEINFKLHDFGFRGVSSYESAGIGGAAHLINFMGTDTIAALLFAREHYNASMPGFSIPAAEHSTMTAEGPAGERAAYQRMIDAYAKPGAVFAVVSDSYDIFNAVENIWCTDNGDPAGGLLRQVEAAGATVVIRPDSGDPSHVPVKIIEMLMKHEGYTVNSKGFKVLPPYVRVIQGDGITPVSLETILNNLYNRQLSASNIAFGMGGGLLQMCNRDTFGFAMKCSARLDADGNWVDVFKDPVGGTKTSKKGRLALIKVDGEFKTVAEDVTIGEGAPMNLLHTIYEHYKNSTTINRITFEEVRKNAAL